MSISVSFSPDGKTLASGSRDNTIKLWDVATGENIATLRGHTSSVFSVSFSPDGKTLASGSTDATIKLWDVEYITPPIGHTSTGSVQCPFRLMVRPLLQGLLDGTIKLWGVVTRQNIATLEGHTGGVNSVSFSPDGKTLASGVLG